MRIELTVTREQLRSLHILASLHERRMVACANDPEITKLARAAYARMTGEWNSLANQLLEIQNRI